MPELNRKNISEFLQAHSDAGLNGIVMHIIQTTKCAANCEPMIANEKYPMILEAAQKRGTLTPTHLILLEQLEKLRKLECHENSLRKKSPGRS